MGFFLVVLVSRVFFTEHVYPLDHNSSKLINYGRVFRLKRKKKSEQVMKDDADCLSVKTPTRGGSPRTQKLRTSPGGSLGLSKVPSFSKPEVGQNIVLHPAWGTWWLNW